MYEGYRIKINGNIFPNRYIARGSYSKRTDDHVIDSYVDAYQTEHIITNRTKTTIRFKIVEHNSRQHTDIKDFFVSRNNIKVNYYDDITDTYKEGIFHIDYLEYSHKNATSSSIQYNATNIEMIEN